ncbi:hypothetical protein [Desulfotalea psychrophila]|uniref:Uncharacterized protein n=1 Tax=Desulfotalea psychrophila (strain LSv54 / DSM 12343) TaxID=177439 RepID=Q6ALP2_DESPS|nr:hypothetical protein [Desulfotalea psychrophila]CAG36733.1 unknown protein [Desulfotalea psychrophila LSv54]
MSVENAGNNFDELVEQYGDENGNIPDTIMSEYLDTGLIPEGDTAAVDVIADEESRPSDQELANPVPDENPLAVEDPAMVKEPARSEENATDQETVVMAKDGVHHIPFSELESERARVKTLEAELATSKQVAAAKLPELDEAELVELAEDYPEIAERFQAMMKEKQLAQEQEENNTQQSQFDQAVAEFNPFYLEAKNDPLFWEWFDKQPADVRAVEQVADPEAIALVVSRYQDSLTVENDDTAEKGDPEKAAEAPKQTAEEIAQAAMAEAKKPAEMQSLSDVPGASTQADKLSLLDNETNAINLMSTMESMSPDDIEEYLSRSL